MRVFQIFQIVINIVFVTLAVCFAVIHYSEGNSSASYGWGLASIWCLLFTIGVAIEVLEHKQ